MFVFFFEPEKKKTVLSQWIVNVKTVIFKVLLTVTSMIVKMMINSIVMMMQRKKMLMEKMNKLYDLLIVMIDWRINHKHILYIHVIQVDMQDSTGDHRM